MFLFLFFSSNLSSAKARVIYLKSKTYHVCWLYNLRCLTASHKLKYRILVKKKNCPWHDLSLTFYLTLYSFLHLHDFSHIVQDNAYLLTLKVKVFCDELPPMFLLSLFSYLTPFFGLYTPTITHTCCFPTRCPVSFL